MRHEPRNWDLVIGGAGRALTDKFYCKINGVRNDELTVASKAEKASMPDILRSETLPIYNDTVRREAFSFFLKTVSPTDQREEHIKHWITVEHSAKNEAIDVVFNKSRESSTN